ncbi:MAG: hypothetical protein NTU58_02085 [Candidatus Nealsonbacteria bacterium]|nr:hypothetical protein [Candidatus Nealsonbacteria bacterium]
MKKIILIAIILFICVGVGIILLKNSGKYSESAKRVIENKMMSSKEKACLNSGGKVSFFSCCKSTGDFPDLCTIGACGCSLENSHEIKICECEPEKCFNGEKCLMFEAPQLPGIDQTI